MNINKYVGYWSEKSTLLDDYAYQLYVNYMISTYELDTNMGPQSSFIISYYNFNEKSVAFPFYKNAITIIRKEKIINLHQ